MAMGTIQGQAVDSNRGDESVVRVEDSPTIMQEDWKQFLYMADVGIHLFSVRASFFVDLQVLRSEDGKMDVSLLVKGVMTRSEGKGFLRVRTYKYMFDSQNN